MGHNRRMDGGPVAECVPEVAHYYAAEATMAIVTHQFGKPLKVVPTRSYDPERRRLRRNLPPGNLQPDEYKH
jgi:hypothetical protein